MLVMSGRELLFVEDTKPHVSVWLLCCGKGTPCACRGVLLVLVHGREALFVGRIKLHM